MNTTKGIMSYTGWSYAEISCRLKMHGFADHVALCTYALSDTQLEERYARLYPSAYQALEKCHRRENGSRKTPVEHGSDLACNWYAEDMESKWLSDTGLIVTTAGCDASRDFLSPAGISRTADLSITTSTGLVSVEIVNAYGDYWSRNGSHTFRGDKFKILKAEKALVAGFNLQERKCWILDTTATTAEDVWTVSRYGYTSTEVRLPDYHDLDLDWMRERIEALTAERGQ